MACGWISMCIFLTLVFSAAALSKYDQNVNRDGPKVAGRPKDRPFRSFKVNMVWEKAQKRLDPGHLADLYSELTIQDKMEMDGKKRKMEGFDDDGEHEAMIRNRLIGVLHKFDLSDVSDDPLVNDVHKDFGRKNDVRGVNEDSFKLDKRLGKLWKKAEMSGFSDKELDHLKREFQHQKDKFDEYDMLRNEIDSIDGIDGDLRQGPKHVQGTKENQFESKNAVKHRMTDLKDKHRDMMEGMRDLEMRTRFKRDDESGFTEPRVLELWHLAKKANFSEAELVSFREELDHFHHKLEKLTHIETEYERAMETDSMMGKHNDPTLPEKKIQLEQHLQDYKRKVKKVHSELKSRVFKGARHTEL